MGRWIVLPKWYDEKLGLLFEWESTVNIFRMPVNILDWGNIYVEKNFHCNHDFNCENSLYTEISPRRCRTWFSRKSYFWSMCNTVEIAQLLRFTYRKDVKYLFCDHLVTWYWSHRCQYVFIGSCPFPSLIVSVRVFHRAHLVWLDLVRPNLHVQNFTK